MSDTSSAVEVFAAGVAAIAAAVRDGRHRAEEMLREHRRRAIDAGGLNALVQPCPDRAAAHADEIDRRLAAGTMGDAPLAGVPVSVKECFPVRGLETTLGMVHRRGALDREDGDLIGKVEAAGGVVVGKANVPQAMYLHETDNPVWGRTMHPLDPARGPGGSSGGDAALVAAGVVPLGIGNDLAGSLRQPAHACGIAALVPRAAVLGRGGAFETLPNLKGVPSRAGFLARRTDDLAVALAVVTPAVGPSAAIPVRRIAWWDDAGPIAASPAVRRGVREAVARLEARGVAAVRVAGDLAAEAAWLHLGIIAADGGDDVRRAFAGERPMRGVAKLLAIAGLPRRWRASVAAVVRTCGGRIEAEGILRTGRRTASELSALVAARDLLATRFADLVAGCDAVICPVSALPALRHGTAARLVIAAAPCLLANLLDLPAGAVPITTVAADEQGRRGWSADRVLRAAADTDRGSAGLPVGVQVVGCPGRDEATVLEVMRLLERRG
ncbi:MAG: amidase family protein [Planctomycetaceae bacterium]